MTLRITWRKGFTASPPDTVSSSGRYACDELLQCGLST
jgi:hypothetical protein